MFSKNKYLIFLIVLVISVALLAGCGSSTTKDSAVQDTVNSEQPVESADAAESVTADAPEVFTYVHDPRDNPTAMKDIIEDPNAVYGFSPNPDSARLGTYAEYDWSDPELVEGGKQNRLEYHKSIEGMYDMLFELRDEGKKIEEMARAISAERNRIRIDSYKDDPEGLAKLKESNLAKYGNEEGPDADSLYEKYGSWELVLQNAFGTNPGMDACCGLYDDYYDLYVELGLIPNP